MLHTTGVLELVALNSLEGVGKKERQWRGPVCQEMLKAVIELSVYG